MKRFAIQYRLEVGTPEAWHQEIARFTAALDADPEIAGRISYRCMKIGAGPAYVHLVAAEDHIPNLLQTRPWFKHYTEETRRISGGKVEVTPIEIVGQTQKLM
jgi:hypothetical protein